MSALRGVRGRLTALGATACILAALLYLHQLHRRQMHQDDALRRCRADYDAAANHLKAIIEYKEQMEHTLAAEKSLHADSAAALHSQKEEQDKLLRHSLLIQNRYNNLSKECEKTKESFKAEQELSNHYKNQHMKLVAVKNDIERELNEKLLNHTASIKKLEIENDRLKKQIQRMSEEQANSRNKPPYVPPIVENKNFSRQIKIAKDLYYIPISSSKNQNDDNNIKDKNLENSPFSNSHPQVGQLNLTNSIHKNDVSFMKNNNFQKSEFPQGVAPELPVDENINEKHFLMKHTTGVKNNGQEIFNSKGDENQEDSLIDPPNRYNVKLSPEDENLDSNLPDFIDKTNKKLIHDELAHENENAKNDNLLDVQLNKSLDNEDNKKKKDDAEDVNISQNNGEPVNNNEIRGEDDDDMDEYGYPRVEGAEDPVNKK